MLLDQNHQIYIRPPSRFQKDIKFFIDQTKTNIGYNMNTTQLLVLRKNLIMQNILREPPKLSLCCKPYDEVS